MARHEDAKQGFLARLARNEAGNTLAMAAAATIPLIGMIGGGVDVSRLYLVKTRLQQACDAGALAGRKAQAGGTWTTTHQSVANDIFGTNFASGAYGTSGLSQNFTESNGKVTGTASVTVPLLIMDMFGTPSKLVSVTCDAEMRLPHSDIMFVLDVTGSMGDPPASGGSTSKLSGLKTAVQCFYEALQKIDTPAACGTTPSGGISDQIQIRYGFVPYSVNVNVGKLLNNDWIANSWTYQSRVTVPTGATPTTYGSWTYYSGPSPTTSTQNNKNNCNASNTITTTTGSPSTSTSTDAMGGTVTTTVTSRTTTGTQVTCTLRNNGNYNITTTTYNNYVERKTDVTAPTYTYEYKPVSLNVAGLKAGGSSWNGSVNLPIGWLNADTSVTWDGCIEERETVRATSFSPIPSGAKDLDIDTVPSTSDATTQWKPMLGGSSGAVWGRTSGGNNAYGTVTTTSNLSRNHSYYCPTAARKLARYMTTTEKDNFVTYVNSLVANGNTYHDIGLLWGARLMSPTGLWASENAFTPQGGEIQRHLIFMTDGDACTNNTNYTAYGVHWWDRRQTDPASAPTASSTSCSNDTTPGQITQQVELRTQALCTAIKNKNITLWVVNYGGGVSTVTGALLQTCASPNRYYEATSTSALLTTFQQIAAQISQLRLTN